MKRPLAIPLTLALALAFLPLGSASAITPAGFDCGPDDGREQLTPDGLRYQFAAPQTPSTGHDLAELGGAPYPALVTEMATARFPVRANLAPYIYGDLEFDLAWVGDGDFDLYVLDAEGNELESSVNFNPLDGNGENLTVPSVTHCDDLTVLVRNYAGQDGEVLTLDITFKFPGPMFACEEDDPHPACEGKEVGEPPARVDDTRTRVYLGGEGPGNVGAASHYVDSLTGPGTTPGSNTMSIERPLGGRTNTYTHIFQGNANNAPNPLQGNWILPLEDPLEVSGDVHVQLWISSQSQSGGPNGKLNVDLYVDSGGGTLAATRVARVIVPGSEISTIPSPLFVTFEDVSFTAEQELILQVAADAVVTSGGVVQATEDLEFTVYYDSVQFPSGITLDTPASAFSG